MDFFSNLFGRLFGKKKEEEKRPQASSSSAPAIRVQSAPVAQPALSVQQPEPVIRMPEISSVALQKAPVQEPVVEMAPQGDLLDRAAAWINSPRKVEAPIWDVGEDASLLQKIVPGAYNILAKPVADAAANFFVNAPVDIGRNLSQVVDFASGREIQPMSADQYKSPIGSVGQRLSNLSVGQDERAQDIIADTGRIGTDAINLVTLGKAGNFIPSTSLSKAAAGQAGKAAQQAALLEIAKGSAKAGATVGAGAGAARGLEQGRDEDLIEQLLSGAVQGGVGAAIGGAVGGALPYVGAAARKATNKVLQKVGVKSVNSVADDAGSAAAKVADPAAPAPGVKSVNPVKAVATAPGPTLADLQNAQRPAQQIELEDLINQRTPGSLRKASQIVDAMPVADPNKASTDSLLDAVAPAGRTLYHSTTGDLDSIASKGLIPGGIDGGNSQGAFGTDRSVFNWPDETVAQVYNQNEGGRLLKIDVPDSALANLADGPDTSVAYNGVIDPSWISQRMPDGSYQPLVQTVDAAPTLNSNVLDLMPDGSVAPAVSVPAPVAQAAADIPGQAPAAPRLREAVIKLLADTDGAIPKNSPMRDTLVIDQATAKARGIINDLADADVLRLYAASSTDELEGMVRTPQDYALAKAALERLYAMAKNGDEAAAATSDNILSAMQFGASKSGQFLRITQEAFDEMPIPMKINKVIGFIEKANASKFGPDSPQVAALKDPVTRTAITTQMDGLFNIDQSIRDDLASANNALEAIKANPSGFTRADVQAAGQAFEAATERLSQNTRQFAQLYDQWVPGTGTAIDTLGNYQRTAMLSSLSGRIQDVLQTTGNAAREINNSMVEGNIGKALNAASDEPGKYLDTGINPWDLVKAVPGALKKTGQQAAGVNEYGSIGDVVSNVKRFPDRTDISGGQSGPVTRLVKAATNFATNLTDGLKEGQSLRLLRQEGLQKGFKGDDLANFIEASRFNPSDEIAAKASLVQQTVNNLNDNPVSRYMRGVGDAAEKNLGKPGKFIKNAVLPFPTWLGGNIWNSITDRNVIANSIKAIANAKRDPQYAVNQLSKAITGATEAYALGWVLSQNGVITETDANGDDYEGIYLHLGNRYIPVSGLGAFAPNVILGYSAFKGFNDEDGQPDGEGILTNIGQTSLNVLAKAFPALDLMGPTGDSSYLTRGLGQIADDPGKGLATIGAGFAGQFIPALGGDINAFLNNYTDLNPTREAPNTKVINPDSPSGEASDPFASGLAQLQSRIPFASQALPRAEGKSALDFIDRITRGTHEGEGTRQREEDALDAEAQVASARSKLEEYGLLKDNVRNILDKDNQRIFDKIRDGKKVTEKDMESFVSGVTKGVTETEDTRFLSDGDYDSNLAVLKMKRAMLEEDPTTRQDTLEAYDKQIKRGEIYKELQTPYKAIKDYKEISLEEWRALGDPESEDYDLERYQRLWEVDTAMTEAGVSRRSSDSEKPKYYLAKSKKKGGGVSKKVSSNTVGTPVDLGRVNLSGITGKATNVQPLQKITKLKPGELLKKRKISVSKGL